MIINFITLIDKVMKSGEKFKIEVILKSSPDKNRYDPKDKQSKYPKTPNLYSQNVSTI